MDLWSQKFHSCTQKRPFVGLQNWHLQHPPIVIDFKRLPLQSDEFSKTLFKSWSKKGTGNMSIVFPGFPQIPQDGSSCRETHLQCPGKRSRKGLQYYSDWGFATLP